MKARAKSAKIWKKALQALELAKARVANEKKKQSEKKWKAENHYKYIMGGIIVKYFPDCYSFDESELNRILLVALQTKECQQMITRIKAESTDWNSKENAKMWRKDLADTINAQNERLGIAAHWELISFKEQGIDREPATHIGAIANALERKGIQTAPPYNQPTMLQDLSA